MFESDRILDGNGQGNHRVMKWKKDAEEGVVVAGGNGMGDSLTQLSSPQGVLLMIWMKSIWQTLVIII